MKEVTFLDRVPTNPGRVVLTPVPGQANTYDMVRADNPTVEGTPLDKATFDSMVHSRLTGRYYIPTVTRAQQGEANVITANPIPTAAWVDNSFSRSTNGAYIATVNTVGGNYPSYAFDGNDNTRWAGAENLTEHWLCLELPEAITVRRIKLKLLVDSSANQPTTTIQGSNNASEWVALATISGTQAFVAEYDLTTTGEYKYYRVKINFNATNVPEIYTFGIARYDVKQYTNAFVIGGELPTQWDEGQRITIQIPGDTNTFGVVSNTLNGVNVNTILQPSRRYELRYTGSAFVAKEV